LPSPYHLDLFALLEDDDDARTGNNEELTQEDYSQEQIGTELTEKGTLPLRARMCANLSV